MTIRLLTGNDAIEYKELRLKALQNNPESYLSTFESEKQRSVEAFSSELRYTISSPIFGYYGIFLENKLIGYASLEKSYLAKQKHIAFFYNLYIDPKYRNQGLALKLFNFILDKIKQKTQIERIFLSCNKKNTPAIKLYKKLGFKEYGFKEKSIKYQDEYDDEIEMVREV
jgi:RimJ/RimL family protein N-acetyltransferase